ncbi:MAG: hypothetical protein Q9M33_13610 [Robiginitomaculum sp.]|nr:hypothetical protein [Robiginitomaculum sp.]
MPNYVTQRANRIYEIRYPIPANVQRFYPKSNGNGFRKQIVKSLSTRDPKEAQFKQVELISELEAEFQVLRGDVDKDRVEAILLRMYAGLLDEFDKDRIDKGLSIDDPLYGLDAKRLNLEIFLGLKGDDLRACIESS